MTTRIQQTLAHLPPVLYKYCPVSNDRIQWIRRYLVQSELYFPGMNSFNDPLDCRIPFTFDAPEDIATAYWQRFARLAAPNATPTEHQQRITELIAQTQTPEGRQPLHEQQFRTFDRNGILCLTTEPHNMLMWSYYGDGHTGVVLRLNMSLDHLTRLRTQYFVAEVQYRADFPAINYYGEDDEKIRDLVATKALPWAHEREWRVVLVNRNEHVRLPPLMIDGVILGLRTSPDHETLIRTWVTERNTPTDMLRAQLRPNSFELEVVPA